MKKFASNQTRTLVIGIMLFITIVEFFYLPLWYSLLVIVPLIPLFMSTAFSSIYIIEDGYLKKVHSGFRIKLSTINKVEKYKNVFGQYYAKIYFDVTNTIELQMNEIDDFINEINRNITQ